MVFQSIDIHGDIDTLLRVLEYLLTGFQIRWSRTSIKAYIAKREFSKQSQNL